MTTTRYLKISSINLFEMAIRDAPPATLQSLLSAIETDRSKKAQLLVKQVRGKELAKAILSRTQSAL